MILLVGLCQVKDKLTTCGQITRFVASPRAEKEDARSWQYRPAGEGFSHR